LKGWVELGERCLLPGAPACGTEDKLHGGWLCTYCTLTDRLAADLLDEGDGHIRPALVLLAESLVGADKPLSILIWLSTRKVNPARPKTRCDASAEDRSS